MINFTTINSYNFEILNSNPEQSVESSTCCLRSKKKRMRGEKRQLKRNKEI